MKRLSFIMVLLFLFGCSKGSLQPLQPFSRLESSADRNQEPEKTQPSIQPAYIKIDKIIPEPSTTLKRDERYDFTLNFTCFYDLADKSNNSRSFTLMLRVFSEATKTGIRQPALVSSKTSMNIVPGVKTSSSFTGQIIVSSYSTEAQPDRLVVDLFLGLSVFGGAVIVNPVATISQVYAVK